VKGVAKKADTLGKYRQKRLDGARKDYKLSGLIETSLRAE
jgi:hypothetical protein